jgi:hypothetical protein
MKIQIRESVFETNSSSTHAISIASPQELFNIPETVRFTSDKEFGWENEIYNDYINKAAYIWLTIISNKGDLKDESTVIDYKIKLTNILKEAGVKNVEFQDYEYVESSWKGGYHYIDVDGYIDHRPELSFVDDLINDPSLLISFLFNPNSEIETGNDNDDHTPGFRDDAVATYWKGN